jgi:myo-inositol 2-dehydrogenase / D-chiro-inositol 1-dehydrogenase
MRDNQTRRDFLKASTVAAGAALATTLIPANVHAAGDDTIKVGLIGCGGRGTGASDNVLHSAKNIKIVALADAFKDRADGCRGRLEDLAKTDEIKNLGNSVDVGDRVFVGLDAYQKLLKCDVNYVILATPPGFRPVHLQAAVAAGKNIFTEKPVSVDGPGIRKVLDAYEDAKKKNLAIVAGTQRRHQLGYVETMKQIHDGAIGDLVGGRGYWNQGILWTNPRQEGWTDLVYQLRNWYNFLWICGDHIVEQHVHNLDVLNWAFNAHPVRAVGMGGRQRSVPNPKDYGNIFDHFAVDYEYPNGVHVMSMCRQISGCKDDVSEALVGTKGTCRPDRYSINGKRVLTREQDRASIDPYVQEHTDLIASIRAGKPLNELKQVAESTLTAILGRMSTYTGKELTWEQALNSKQDLMPPDLNWDMSLAEGAIPVPGKTDFI